jgi:hypothetical protein
MNILGSALASVVRGGVIKEAFKSAGRGIKSLGKSAIKGVKSLVGKGSRGTKQLKAEVKSLPTGVERVGTMITRNPDAWAKSTPYEKYRMVIDRVNKVRLDAGKKALKEAKQEDLVKLLQKTTTTIKANKSLKKILQNARKDETWGQMRDRLTGQAKKLFGGLAQGGMENVAIDQTMQLLGKGALGLGGGVVAGATTAAIMDKKK